MASSNRRQTLRVKPSSSFDVNRTFTGWTISDYDDVNQHQLGIEAWVAAKKSRYKRHVKQKWSKASAQAPPAADEGTGAPMNTLTLSDLRRVDDPSWKAVFGGMCPAIDSLSEFIKCSLNTELRPFIDEPTPPQPDSNATVHNEKNEPLLDKVEQTSDHGEDVLLPTPAAECSNAITSQKPAGTDNLLNSTSMSASDDLGRPQSARVQVTSTVADNNRHVVDVGIKNIDSIKPQTAQSELKISNFVKRAVPPLVPVKPPPPPQPPARLAYTRGSLLPNNSRSEEAVGVGDDDDDALTAFQRLQNWAATLHQAHTPIGNVSSESIASPVPGTFLPSIADGYFYGNVDGATSRRQLAGQRRLRWSPHRDRMPVSARNATKFDHDAAAAAGLPSILRKTDLEQAHKPPRDGGGGGDHVHPMREVKINDVVEQTTSERSGGINSSKFRRHDGAFVGSKVIRHHNVTGNTLTTSADRIRSNPNLFRIADLLAAVDLEVDRGTRQLLDAYKKLSHSHINRITSNNSDQHRLVQLCSINSGRTT